MKAYRPEALNIWKAYSLDLKDKVCQPVEKALFLSLCVPLHLSVTSTESLFVRMSVCGRVKRTSPARRLTIRSFDAILDNLTWATRICGSRPSDESGY